MTVLGATLGATFRLKKVGWLCCVALLQLFGSCTTTKFRKPASRWLSSFPGSGKHQHGMLRPRGIAIGCFKFAPRTTCAGPPTAVDNVLSPFPHKIKDARAWATVIESEMTRGSRYRLRRGREKHPRRSAATSLGQAALPEERPRLGAAPGCALLRKLIAGTTVDVLSGTFVAQWRDRCFEAVSVSAADRDLNPISHTSPMSCTRNGVCMLALRFHDSPAAENRCRNRRLSDGCQPSGVRASQ